MTNSQMKELCTLLSTFRGSRKQGADLSDSEPSWIRGISLYATGSAILFVLNLILISTVVGLGCRYSFAEGGFSSSIVFYKGDCQTTNRFQIVLDLIINILGTTILAASNYCMQTLTAPSREEVDACHARYRWLDIGSGSVRNLFLIKKTRFAIWGILLITVTPFHLLYNSMIFQARIEQQFNLVLGPKDLNSSNVRSLTTPNLHKCFDPRTWAWHVSLDWNEFVMAIESGTYDLISATECLDLLGSAPGTSVIKSLVLLSDELIVSQGGDASVLFVSPQIDQEDSSAIVWTAASFSNHTSLGRGDPTVCNNISTLYGPDSPSWFNAQYNFSQCLAVKGDEKTCQLRYSPLICIVITLSMLIKIVAMFLAARINRSRSPPLFTVGDAVASFLASPDPMTEGLCWMSKADVCNGRWKTGRQSPQLGNHSQVITRYESITYSTLPELKRWARGASVWRWSICLLLCAAYIALGAYIVIDDALRVANYADLLRWPTSHVEAYRPKTLDIEASGYTIFGIDLYYFGIHSTGTIIMANLPQLLITLGYFCFNSLLTSMLTTAEYSSYGSHSQPLRVTWPVSGSQQRSSYWLSIPFKYGLPTMAVSMMTHWLVSQAFSFVLVASYDVHDQLDTSNTHTSVNFRYLFIFLSTIVVGVMLLFVIILATRRLKSEIPIAANCSAAISAACHPPMDNNRDSIATGLVVWGETVGQPCWMTQTSINTLGFSSEMSEQKGHCSFTSSGTVKPSSTKQYA